MIEKVMEKIDWKNDQELKKTSAFPYIVGSGVIHGTRRLERGWV
jgi:hypothetical protein